MAEFPTPTTDNRRPTTSDLRPCPRINEHYLKLKAGYLFPEIARRVNAFADAHADANIIRLGIGDVTEPLPPACVAAMHAALDEMADRETFRGYGPEQGYDFLRQAIAQNDYLERGVNVAADEIFVSDGSKCDTGNILDIFGADNKIAVQDPVYPVYVDTNVMAGHTGPADNQGRFANLVYLPCVAENNFTPQIPGEKWRHHLSLLPEQSHRRRRHARDPHSLGRIRQGQRRHPVLRRGLRGVRRRPGDPPFDLRDPRRAGRRHRIPQLQQERRLHRHALRFHCCPEVIDGRHRLR